MKAVVMAGGEGSRLRPLTVNRPKPMLPVVNRPLLGHILHLLREHEIRDVLITVQYMAAQIQDYFTDGRTIGMNIEYVVEESPLGTAGSVKNAEPFLSPDEPFLVLSGDALTDFDLQALVDAHRQKSALVTMALYEVADPLEYGVINVGPDGRVLQFLEKPSWGEVSSDTVNTGIYVMQPEVLSRLNANERSDWSQDVFPGMLLRGEPLYGYVAKGYWADIGNLSEYRRANADMLRGLINLGPIGRHLGNGVWTGLSGAVSIDPRAQILGPVYLGDEVKVRRDAIIQGPTVIRDYTIIDDGARVDRCIIWRNCYVGPGAELHGAVIGRQSSLKARSFLYEGAIIGDSTVVGQDAVIHGGVKLWPNKEVEANAIVRHSIIWGSQGRRVLFGRYGVSGMVNVDLTPEFVARLGAAFGSVLPKGSTVTINRDPHRSPRMIKRAIISGLPSAGNNVLDLRNLPIPVARYYTRAVGAAGGVHVRLSPFDERVVDIRFIGHDGLNLRRDQERQIERIFFREDYRRAYMEDIGNIEYAADAVEVYARGYLRALDESAIRNAGFKIVVDYAHAPSADVLPDLMERLQVETVPLNARVNPNRISPPQDEFRAGRAQLARITAALDGITIGVRLDVGGEKLFVSDNTGVDVPDRTMAMATAWLVFRTYPGSTVVVPVDQPEIFEDLAKRFGGRVRRCPVDPNALMHAAAEGDVAMAADGAGNFVFPRLHPAIDGLFALGKLLELLARQKLQLSDVIAQLPPYFLSSSAVDGLWESKGRVMRCLIHQFSLLQHQQLDGIKVFLRDHEWVLIRPDSDTTIFHVTAEAPTQEAAMALVADYSGLVTTLVAMPCDGAVAPEIDETERLLRP